MIPAVELIANQNKPTDRVFTIRKRYSRTPGSTIQFFLITSNWLFCCRSNQSFGYLQQLILKYGQTGQGLNHYKKSR
jgi:hypothetical protein